MTDDLLIFNNSEKTHVLFQGQVDSSNNKLYHTFENLDLSGLSSGEYTVYCVRNEFTTAVTWDVQDVPLNSILTYEEIGYKLSDLKPEISLMKIGTEATSDDSEYRAKNDEYAYRKRK